MTYVSASFDQPPRYPLLKFFHELHLLYKDNAWLFLKIAMPPVVFSSLAILAANTQWTAMVARLPRGPELRFYSAAVLAAVAVRSSGWLISWIVNAFCFAAVSVAVERVLRGERPSAEECYAPARERTGSIVVLGLILLGFFMLAIVGAGIVGFATFRLFRSAINPLSWLVLIAGSTVAATYALAIPASLFEGLSIRAALTRSDFLTGSTFGQLFALLAESFASAYIAAFVPYWIADVIADKVGWAMWANWITWACATYGVAMADLVLLIGLSVLYHELSAAARAKTEAQAHSSELPS